MGVCVETRRREDGITLTIILEELVWVGYILLRVSVDNDYYEQHDGGKSAGKGCGWPVPLFPPPPPLPQNDE